MIRSLLEWALGFVPGVVVFVVGGDPLWGLTASAMAMLAIALLRLLRKHRLLVRCRQRQNDLIEDFRTAVEEFIPPRVHARRITIIYYVGLTRQGDWQERHYDFSIAVGEKPILGKELDFGATGVRGPRSLSFEDLGLTASSDSGTEVLLLPIEDALGNGRIKVCAWFLPSIRESESRSVSVSAKVRGIWGDLRAQGLDKSCSYHLTDIADELRIVVVPPPGIPAGRLEVRRDPTHRRQGVIEMVNLSPGLQGVSWTILSPAEGTYPYRVRCLPIKNPWRRAWLLLTLYVCRLVTVVHRRTTM